MLDGIRLRKDDQHKIGQKWSMEEVVTLMESLRGWTKLSILLSITIFEKGFLCGKKVKYDVEIRKEKK